MHIGIVAPCSSGPLADLLPQSGGVDLGCGGYLVATLARALIKRNHRVSVVTLSSDLDEPRVLKGPTLTFYLYPMRTRKRMRDLYKVEREALRDGISKARPDVLHAHWTYEFALACLETGVPTVVTVHDNAFRVLWFQRDLYRLGRAYLQVRVMRNARALTAVSPYIADSLRWLAKRQIEVVPNAVEISHNGKTPSERTSKIIRIATVLNGWGNLKNSKAAIKAFALLRSHLPDTAMFMYGQDFEKGGVAAQWAESKGLAQNIDFCGPLPHEELQRQLRRASILLHPSLEESFSMVVLEAMSLGLPVIGGIESGGVPWLLDEGRAGFLTNVSDPTKIAETLLTCIQQTADRRQRQRAAYDRVVSLFSASSVAEQYEAIYAKALSSKTSTGILQSNTQQ